MHHLMHSRTSIYTSPIFRVVLVLTYVNTTRIRKDWPVDSNQIEDAVSLQGAHSIVFW